MEDLAELFQMHFIGPLGETDQADYRVWWVGPWLESSVASIDWALFSQCLEYQPDVVFVYGWYPPSGSDPRKGMTSLFTFYLLRKLLGLKVVALLHDQHAHQFRTTDTLTSLCDMVFTHEHEDTFRNHSSFPEKHIVTPSTFSPSLFHSDLLEGRSIDLAFVGGLGGRYPPERADGIAALRASGLEVSTPGGRDVHQTRISNEEYARVFKSSKIVLNWSRHISGGWFQAKGRVFEATLAGAMLLCEECDAVNKWFRPYVDYIPFSNPEELVQRAKYYLDHEEDRLKIAAQGNQIALSQYSAEVVWAQRLQVIRDMSRYQETEAVEGLRRSASSNELKVARYFQRELNQFPQFNQSVIDEAVAIVEMGHKSLARRVRWEIDRLRWQRRKLRGLHWKILRKLLPSFITRKRLRSGFFSLARRLSH